MPASWDQAMSLAYYMICEGSAPLSRFPRFAATHATPHGAPIASQRSSELLASIGEAERDAFCSALARMRGEGDRLFYDTTSISPYSDALSRVRWGRNKDRVPLPQINLPTLVGRGRSIPLYCRKVAGNVADVTTVKTLVRDMEPAFAGKVRLVMDRGFWSAANVNAMMREHFKFLIGVPASLKLFKDAVEKRFGDVKGLLDFRTPRVSTEETLAGKLFVVFVALAIAAWPRGRMRKTGLDDEYTLEGLLDEVEAIERYAQEGRRPRVCEVTRKQRAIFDRLGYDLPATP